MSDPTSERRGKRLAWQLAGPYRVTAPYAAPGSLDADVAAAVERLLNDCSSRVRCSCGWQADGGWEVATTAGEHLAQQGHSLEVEFGGDWWPLRGRVERR